MKDFKIYIAVASALALCYLIAQYNRPTPTNWQSTLYYNDKIPFGTYILYNRLNDIFPEAAISRTNQSAYAFFSDTTRQPGNYLIIANGVEMSNEDYGAMEAFIRKGNSVFISSYYMGRQLIDTLKLRISSNMGKSETSVNFSNPQLKQGKNYVFDKHIAGQYFDEIDTARATVIGQNAEGRANYVSYTFGKGKLLLFPNPQVLTNYSLLKPQSVEYAEKVLSYLPEGAEKVYWDQFQNHDIPTDQSPMRVFLQHQALQWAYYLALATILLYVAYQIKRRQRIIPIVEPLKNATLDFVTVVGKVYYEQRDNSNISAKKVIYFSEHLRTVFGLKPGNYPRDFVALLASKTGIDALLADELVSHIGYLLQQSRVTDHELIILNQLIEKFYIQTGFYGK